MTKSVINFIAEETGADAATITLNSALCADLGLAGDTGRDLMMKFAGKYSVDLKHFNSADYFGEEGGNPLMIFLPRLKPKLKPLTVADLVEAASKAN